VNEEEKEKRRLPTPSSYKHLSAPVCNVTPVMTGCQASCRVYRSIALQKIPYMHAVNMRPKEVSIARKDDLSWTQGVSTDAGGCKTALRFGVRTETMNDACINVYGRRLSCLVSVVPSSVHRRDRRAPAFISVKTRRHISRINEDVAAGRFVPDYAGCPKAYVLFVSIVREVLLKPAAATWMGESLVRDTNRRAGLCLMPPRWGIDRGWPRTCAFFRS